MTTHAKTKINPARGPIRGVREANRRKMKALRVAITPGIALRIRHWYATIERARDEDTKSKTRISLGCDRYLKRLKGLPTVQAGGFADVRDEVMGAWLGRSRHTIMRYRAEAVRAGLLEDKGTRGLDHKPCMVRPILSDGSPVFTGTSATHSVAKVVHERASESDLPKTSPPTPSAEPPKQKEECGPALVAPDVVSEESPVISGEPPVASEEPPPAKPPEREEQGPGNDAVAAPEPITFDEVWAASDKAGPITYAEQVWRTKLTDADKAAIAAVLKREGQLQTGLAWVGKWLLFRRWPTLSVPKTRGEIAGLIEGLSTSAKAPSETGFRVNRFSANGEAWLRYWLKHGQRGLPAGGDGRFVRNLPSLWPPE
jgi:hypothetical protein